MENIYNERICKLFRSAEKERESLNHEYVGTEHLLLAILNSDAKINKYLRKHDLTYNNFKNFLKNNMPCEDSIIKDNIYTPLLKKIILFSSENINEEKLLFNMLDASEGVAIRLLINMNIDVDAIYNYLKNSNSYDNLLIYKYGKILNKTIDYKEHVVGRDKEINLVLETLLRKKKNNPLLIGEAGVGKSAIVEEIARKIVSGNIYEEFLDKVIVELSMASLISGTKYRGEFEDRLNKIILEIKEHSEIILFIDEVHTMASAGAAEGAISAGDILKPFLARGDIKCIGATTREEYEKYILKDKALSRRFETIFVKEPNENDTINILKNIKKEYINYHKVNISDENIELIVHLANVYFPNKKNPDKAIELLDSVLSYVKLNETSNMIKEKEYKLKQITNKKLYNLENDNFKEALFTSKEENNLKKDIMLLKSGKNICVKKHDILDVLELKNNIINKNKMVKVINDSFKDKYDKSVVKKITNKLNNNKISILTFIGDYKNVINDLADKLNYDIVRVGDNMEKLISKLKYNPSTMFIVNNNDNYNFNNLIKKAKENNLVEYNNEYISFNSAIIIYTLKEKNIGFLSNNYCDEAIYFEKTSV